jgi:DNA-binding NarL/FixJ family response regulator
MIASATSQSLKLFSFLNITTFLYCYLVLMNERVLIVIDDGFELSTLVPALRLHEMDIIGEARSESMALNLLNRLQPDVVLLDMHVAGISAIKIAVNLRKAKPEVGIVILESCSDVRLLGDRNMDIPMGSKIILKKSATDLLILCAAISDSQLSAKENHEVSWINGSVSIYEKSLQELLLHLTDAQVQTLRLVADGLTNAQIGRVRYTSEKAVEQIISRVAQEFNIQPDRNRNMRVQLVNEYYKWLGAPHH